MPATKFVKAVIPATFQQAVPIVNKPKATAGLKAPKQIPAVAKAPTVTVAPIANP